MRREQAASATPSATASASTARHRLNAATTVLWRGEDCVQLELGSRALVIEHARSADIAALVSGSGVPVVETTGVADRAGLADLAELSDLVEGLRREGFTDRVGPTDGEGAPVETFAALPGRLAADLRAAGIEHGANAAAVLRARRRAAVAVHGTSRVAVTLAATLAAAGVGWVQLAHGGEVRAADTCPGGLAPDDEGRRFAIAAVDAIRRAAPEAETSALPADRPPDLTILTDPEPIELPVRSGLHLDNLAHLAVQVEGSRAVIGPLVVPGVTSCLRCCDLHRRERDTAWPLLAVQLANRPRRVASSDVSLCIAAAGVAASQALCHLDGGHPATLNGTLEWLLPDWRLRRRTWPTHHDCDCGAAGVAETTRPDGKIER